ncbi:hypothetical protein J7E96_15105 [Streptomyces sp. ISL-96]|uniref:hypothetical protein n=1 Tax=Streptomyces sp. ISL-96 TaxID=2819191 RepID=UPI001BE55C56|nr:hypothetical protein [Streptomyces sp. ISL-96]MBT2489818.1 hypothetical protein [Streptomyces sp. ISL-96]
MIPMEQYKSARADAEHLTTLLRSALTRAGISDDEAGKVRPLVTATGRAYVQFGALQLRDAVKLLEALALSRTAPRSAEGPTLPAEAFG